MRGTVLVVDDQSGARAALAAELADAGYLVFEASDGDEGWRVFRDREPDLVITDMVMPRSDGIELLNRIRGVSDTPVVVLTAYGSIESAVSAVKAGAADFLSSSQTGADDVVELADQLLQARRRGTSDLADLFPGGSALIQKTRERLTAVAPLETPVLISGEPGTGHNLAARALHGLSSRSTFIATTAEAFSPTQSLPPAPTIYLADVERLGQPAQQRLLGLLKTEPPELTARLITSTSVTLSRTAGFEPRLAEALGRFEIVLPALRDRPSDMGEIATALIDKIGVELGRPSTAISRSAIQLLAEQPWPGNVTELAQVLERGVAFSPESSITRELVADILRETQESLAQIRGQHLLNEREQLLEVIRSTGGNISRAAHIMGRSRTAVYRLISKHRIRVDEGK